MEVRQANRADWPMLRRFVYDTYREGAMYKDWARQRWQFLENPHNRPTGGVLPIWVALDAGTVAGVTAVQAGTLQLAGVTRQAGWIVDVMVRPEYRGQGLGHRIHAEIANSVPILVTLTMAKATRRIAERAGCVTLGEARQYSRVANPTAEDVRRYLFDRTRFHPALNRGARLGCEMQAHRLITATARARSHIRRRAVEVPAGITLEEVPAFGAEIDDLWERTRDQYDAIFVRDSRHLNWRFGNPPDLIYRRFVSRRGGSVSGYVVLRRARAEELRLGIVADAFAARDDATTWRALIAHAVRFFGDDVAAVEAAASLECADEGLRQAGFRVTRRLAPTVVASDPIVRALVSESKEGWYFTKGDHDWDQVHVT
jgi:GNAT superfamily N-acetyltransferase